MRRPVNTLFIDGLATLKPAMISPAAIAMRLTNSVPIDATGSIVGSGAQITGNLDAKHPIQIDGIVEGEIRGTAVRIGPTASVKGSVYAETLSLAGSMEGTIEAAAVNIEKGASFMGEVTCGSFGVEEGADIQAHCEVSQHKIYHNHEPLTSEPVNSSN